jgi:hypothetical protein
MKLLAVIKFDIFVKVLSAKITASLSQLHYSMNE